MILLGEISCWENSATPAQIAALRSLWFNHLAAEK
jgi:hypothetical protein